MKTAIIVGGGFAGVTAANMLKEKGFKVTILEAGYELGGGCRTYFYHGHPYTYGPHHLLINLSELYVLDYFKKYLDIRELDHRLLTFVEQDSKFYGYPIHEDDIEIMPDRDKIQKEIFGCDEQKAKEAKNFEDFWVNTVGETLYNKYIHKYSEKMWQVRNNKELDEFGYSPKGAAIKKGSRTCFEGVKKICYPTAMDGYNSYFDICVDGCDVVYGAFVEKFELDKKRVFAKNQWFSADLIINTASLDMVFDYCYGELKYIGREFDKVILPTEYAFRDEVHFVHYAGDEPYTRIVEYKKMTGYKSKDTLIIIEKPSFKNKLYPYITKSEIAKADRYKGLIPQDCHSIGRMGTYHYDNMDVIVKDCLELMKNI